MSEPRLISPMLDGFSMGGPISDHHGVQCCPAMPNSSDSKYIVKIISIPASQVQLQALLLTGAFENEDAARDYFRDLAHGIAAETDVLNKLSKLEGFLPFEGCQIVPMEKGVGYQVYLLGSYRRSLERHMRKTAMTHLAAINLGLDMCASLAVARQSGYLYADLKPENIFVCNDQEFRIGDLGFLKLDSLKYASLPERCISRYTAPEIVDAYSDVNTTIDTYAAGLILYQIYNGGELPFADRADAEALPAPAYADYELAAIICKACAPNPADRWKDPIAMGQALVTYMQKNGVNDVPIVIAEPELPLEEAPAAQEEPVAAEEAPAEVPAEEVQDASEQICLDEFYEYFSEEEEAPDEEEVLPEIVLPQLDAEENADDDAALLNLSFLDELVSDDTAPSEDMAGEFGYDALSEDASSILSLADDLISHETPEGVVAPEPIEVPMPEPIVLPKEEPEAEPEAEAEFEAEPEAEKEPASELEDEEEYLPEEPHEEVFANEYEEPIDPEHRRKIINRWLSGIMVVLLLLCLGVGGYIFYREYYIRSVTSLILQGSEDRLVVNVIANVDDEYLTVSCVDTYGTALEKPVINGQAEFTNLNPNTLYTVKVNVSGLRRLTGDTLDSYTTPVQTKIVSMSAVTGNESGSVILSFTVDGMDSETWAVTCSAEGEEDKKLIFGGHMVDITGLTPGKRYTFTLEPGDQLFLTGTNSMEYTAQDPVFAQNLAITGCTENSLLVQWEVPEGAEVTGWTVRCYNESGYDQTVTTADTAVTFTGLNGNEAHTVEVIADGMSSGNRCYMTANAVTVSNVRADRTDAMGMKILWDYAGNTPTGSWIVTYSIDGSSFQEMVRTDVNEAQVFPMIPGANYTVTILLEDGTSVFSEVYTVPAPKADTFEGYLLKASNIIGKLCRTPDKDYWTHNDLTADDYTSNFSVGSNASIILISDRYYNTSDDVITSMFVIHDDKGTLISSEMSQQVWTDMWYKRHCELDIPKLPDAPGNYQLDLYFGGAYVLSLNFTVVSG